MGELRRIPSHKEISEAASTEGEKPREGSGRRLTSEVALLCEGNPQVAVWPAEAVSEESREGGRVLPQELPPPGQLLQ